MSASSPLAPYFRRLEDFSTFRWVGRVTKVVDYLVESEGPFCSVGEGCAILTSDGRTLAGEIVGFREKFVLSMPLERPTGIRYGDRLVTRGTRPCLRVGPGLLGRVIDGAGEPLDSKGSYGAREYRPLRGDAPLPLSRTAIREPLGCGIRAIDGMLTCGRGQRMGIFGGSGVGKSTLVGMMTRGTSADLTVLALVGERGREVRDFLEGALGEEGLARSVVVVSTSDQPPLSRIRAALAATTIAEYFAAQGKHVLLVTDSLTRFAMAQREIGLAAGEPPTAKGYTPSVFTLLAQLLERAGHFGAGSITGFYTVLMEGDDQQDPLVDAARSLLDGHVVLDRRLAARGHYPPISALDSLSRLMPSVCVPEHLMKAVRLRSLLASYAASEDLIRVGAYQKGGDPTLDQALAALPAIQNFLQQNKNDKSPIEQTVKSLLALPG
jgi:flagellum-specific ATP synthase